MASLCYQEFSDLIRMEIEFLQFYHHLIRNGLRMIDLQSNIHFLRKVKDPYSKYSLKNGLSDVSFQCTGIRSAYIFSYGPLFTGNVAYHFLNLMHSNPWLLKKAIAQESLSICCLGGGPGIEIVAIVKALELSLKLFCLNTKHVTISANIIDIDSGWMETMKLISENWWKFFDANYVRLKLSFVQFDLTQTLSGNLQDVIRRSHLITMVNFVSAVYGTKCRQKISEMLQEIMNHMDINGVIFYVNCSRFSCVKELNNIIATSRDMDVIYGPIYNHVYQISRPCLDVCYNLYARHFGEEPPTIQCKNHVAAWRKIEVQEES